jgi:hypothetical protein
MMTLKPGQSWRSPATFRQQGVLDRLQRDIEGLATSPAAWCEDLYKSIGPAGVEKARAAVTEARASSGRASAVIDVFLNRSLTATVRYLIEGTLNTHD